MLLYFLFALPALWACAQVVPGLPNRLKPEGQKLLLQLATNYFTVVKENQVDLDSSLVHVSNKYKLSRLSISAEGITNKQLLNSANWFDERNIETGKKALIALKGKQRAEQLILIGAFYAFEPGFNASANAEGLVYLNQAKQVCQQVNDEELYLTAQRLIAKIMLKQLDIDGANKIFQDVIKGFEAVGNMHQVAKTYQWWALYMPVASTTTAARLKNITLAIQLFNKLGDTEEEINATVNNCYLLLLSYNIEASLKAAEHADSLTNSINFPYTHYVFAALNVVTLIQGKFGEPLRYALEAAQNAEQLKDSIGLPYYYSQIANLYNNEGVFNETAIEWDYKAINCFLDQNEPCYLTLANTVSQLLYRNRANEAHSLITSIYSKTPPKIPQDSLFYFLALANYNITTGNQDLNPALNYLSLADNIEKKMEENGMDIRKAAILFSYGQLYFNHGKFKEARPFLKQYIQQPSNGGGTIYTKTQAWSMLVHIDSMLNDKDQALKDYANFTSIINENYRISKTRLAEELQVRYATEEKEHQIKILQQKTELEQANYRQANQVKNITIGAIILLLIIAALLYRQMRLKQKSNNIITKKNELLQRLVDEKEWLVKEIHHRVKNNLHTVICLLESQAAYLDNDALKAIENSQHRIYAMSLIHQKLYLSEDIKAIDMQAYLTEFVEYIIQGFGSPVNISVRIDADKVMLDVVQAIPVGLIINEGISNAFKHAFPNHQSGKIIISFKHMDNDLLLTISDDGVGFNINSTQENNSLGLELIRGLSKDLHGYLTINNNKGTTIRLRFLVNPIKEPLHSGLNEVAL